MAALQVFILDKDTAGGAWVVNQLQQIGIAAQWVTTASELLAESELRSPAVCLVALRSPTRQVLALITTLTQEPRFAGTAFILMGPQQYKQAAFEIGAADYLITPPDVIELRKRVRLYLDRAAFQARVVAETSIFQDIEHLTAPPPAGDLGKAFTLLEHTAALTQEHTLFNMILQQAGPAIGMVKPDGTLRYANPAWEKMTGLRAGQVMVWPPTADSPEIAQQIAWAVAQGVPWSGELVTSEQDKPRAEVMLSMTPALDANGNLDGFIVVQSNISQRRASQRGNERLLIGAVTEMRTPVTNIKMREYLMRQAPPDQHPMHIQALARETEKLAHLADTMLELSQLDANLTAIRHELVDVPRLVSEAITYFTAAAADRSITLVQPASEPFPPVVGDTLQLTRALGIVIENALDYTPEAGRVQVKVGHEQWSGGEFVTIHVQDTGIGMAADEIPLIFNHFYRAPRARSRNTRGVGLGLAIAQAIIDRHNGSITVESEMDRGSTFTLWLPCAPSIT